MNSTIVKESQVTISDLAKAAVICALYVTLTASLFVISFGPVQFRLAEMFNFLALYHKRYVYAVTLGVIFANFFSPTWMLDVPIGGTCTFLVLMLCRLVTKKVKSEKWKLGITTLIFALSMFTVAIQLNLLLGYSFWPTYLTVGVGELLSMTVGAITIYLLRKKIDFSR